MLFHLAPSRLTPTSFLCGASRSALLMFFICFPRVSKPQQKQEPWGRRCGVNCSNCFSIFHTLSHTPSKNKNPSLSPDTDPLTLAHTAATQLFDSQGQEGVNLVHCLSDTFRTHISCLSSLSNLSLNKIVAHRSWNEGPGGLIIGSSIKLDVLVHVRA